MKQWYGYLIARQVTTNRKASQSLDIKNQQMSKMLLNTCQEASRKSYKQQY